MSIEMSVLAWACVLGIVQIFVIAQLKSREYGTAWGFSSREATMPAPSPFVGIMVRAQANFLETFPIAATAVLVIELAALNSNATAAGAIIWLAARLAYWPIYAAGIPVIRTVMFAISVIGIGMIIWPALL